jgi:hypothetical protein
MQQMDEVVSPETQAYIKANKKTEEQLGIKYRTASHRLERKIFFSLLLETGRDTCFRCGKPLTEHTYSLDHMENWLNSRDPKGLFYDIKNIDFSCKPCNKRGSREVFTGGKTIIASPEVVLKSRKPLLKREDCKTTFVDRLRNFFK